MEAPNTVVIVGAGVMGLGVAWQLSKAGCHVVVLEKDKPGSGASCAAAGMLGPIAELEFDESALLDFGMASQKRWPQFVQELERDAGMSVEFETSGTLLVACDRDESAALQRVHAYQQRLGLRATWLSGRGLRKLEPMLSPHIVGGIHCQDDWQVSNRQLVRALEAAAKNAGVHIKTGTEVRSLNYTQGTVTGVQTTSGENIQADMTIVAAGAWSHALGIDAVLSLPIRPMKGQMMAVQMDVSHPIVHHVIRRPFEGLYLVPKADGTLVIGGTCEDMGFDHRITAHGLRHILDGAFEIMPVVDELPVKETWVGFRPASVDGQPLIGKTSIAGLGVITGHYRHGIQMSAISIDVMTRHILGEPMEPVAQAFDPMRFSPR